MTKRNYITEILQKKQRNGIAPNSHRWELVSERINDIAAIPDVIRFFMGPEDLPGLENLEGYSRVMSIYDKVRHSFSINSEVARYIPIGLVACMEGYFRKVYTDLIDHGSPYKDNASKFTDIRFSIEMAISLERHSLSIGDFIAHLLTTNNLADINNNVSLLIEQDFLQLIREARPEAISHSYELRLDDDDGPCIGEPNYDRLNSHMIKSVKRMFELRHMFCHEIDPKISPNDFRAILHYPEIAVEFLLISEFVVKRLLSAS
jgi:hypothetical protein